MCGVCYFSEGEIKEILVCVCVCVQVSASQELKMRECVKSLKENMDILFAESPTTVTTNVHVQCACT